jgi:hypothetical protein
LATGATLSWLLCSLAAFAPATTAGAAKAPPAVTIAPMANLGSQVVDVSWSGFPRTNTQTLDYAVDVLQCPYPVIGLPDYQAAGCYNVLPFGSPDHSIGSYQTGLLTAKDGTGRALFEVRAGQDLPSLNCSQSNVCSIVVRAYAFQKPDVTVVTAIRFGPSFNDCPIVGTPDIKTSGESSANRVMQAWAAHRCTGTDPLAIDYTELSSDEGRKEFQKSLIDFGITSLPYTASELAAGSLRPYTYAPLDANAVVVAFSIPNAVTGGPPIQSVNLTPRLLARLITDTDPSSGFVTTNIFQDPEFLKLNTLPQGSFYPQFNSMGVLLRAGANADATLVTSWIQADPTARQFLSGNDQYCTNPSYHICVNPAWRGISFPTDEFGKSISKPPVTDLATITEVGLLPEYAFYRLTQWGDNSNKPPNPIFAQGVFAVMDLASARTYHLGIANLCSTDDPASCIGPDGTASGTPGSNAGLIAGYQAMTTNPDGITKVPNYAAASPAYPLVKYDYAVVPTKDLSTTTAQKAKDFLNYVADPNGGQSTSVLPDGYVPLTSAVADQTRAAAGAIQPVSPPVTTTTTAAPTTTTTTNTQATATAATPGGVVTPAAPTPASPQPATTPPSSVVHGPVVLPKQAQVALRGQQLSRVRAPVRAGVFGAIADNPGRLVLPALMGLGILALLSGPILQRWAKQSPARPGRVSRAP